MHLFLASEAVSVLIFDPGIASQTYLTWIWSLELEAEGLFLWQKHQHQHPVSGGRIGSVAMATATVQCQQQCGCTR